MSAAANRTMLALVAERSSSSPRITHLSWGRIEVEGGAAPLKDAKLFPGGAREWDWNETGTRHSPGIRAADVAEILERGVHVVVLSCGMQGRLQVHPETLGLLRTRGVAVHVLQTEEAVALYNELAGSEAVGGLFHSTC
ncbi:MAG: Mth938-like domain-containing protein [Candidatus Binatia bacterium]